MSRKKFKLVGDYIIYQDLYLGDLMRTLITKKMESIYQNNKKYRKKSIKQSYEKLINSPYYRLYSQAILEHPLYRFFKYDYEKLYEYMKKIGKQNLVRKILTFQMLTPLEIWLDMEKEFNLNVFQAKIEEEEAIKTALEIVKGEMNNINTIYSLKWLQQLYEKLQRILNSKR